MNNILNSVNSSGAIPGVTPDSKEYSKFDTNYTKGQKNDFFNKIKKIEEKSNQTPAVQALVNSFKKEQEEADNGKLANTPKNKILLS